MRNSTCILFCRSNKDIAKQSFKIVGTVQLLNHPLRKNYGLLDICNACISIFVRDRDLDEENRHNRWYPTFNKDALAYYNMLLVHENE